MEGKIQHQDTTRSQKEAKKITKCIVALLRIFRICTRTSEGGRRKTFEEELKEKEGKKKKNNL